jgi:hypothetical protein
LHNHHTTKMPTLTPDELIALGARQAIEHLAPQPIPLSERKPEDGDCMEIKSSTYTMHYCWLGYSILHAGIERLIWDWKAIPFATDRGWERFTHWLPASTRFLPARVEG